jgi:hypothetical protein
VKRREEKKRGEKRSSGVFAPLRYLLSLTYLHTYLLRNFGKKEKEGV